MINIYVKVQNVYLHVKFWKKPEQLEEKDYTLLFQANSKMKFLSRKKYHIWVMEHDKQQGYLTACSM